MIRYFDNSTSNIPLKKIENFYNTVGNIQTARGFDFNQQYVCAPNSAEKVVVGNAYEIEYSDFKLTKTIETDYYGGNIVSKSINYGNIAYPTDSSNYGNSFLNYKSYTSSLNESISETYKYPFGFNGSEYLQMKSSHFFPVIESIFATNSQITSKSKTLYQSTLINDKYYPMPVQSLKSKGDNAYESSLIIDSYDNYGFIKQYHKVNGTYVSFYNNGDGFPIYKAEGQPWDFNYSSLFNNPNLQVTKYIYIGHNLLSGIIFPNGTGEYYKYDGFERLVRVYDNNWNILKINEYSNK